MLGYTGELVDMSEEAIDTWRHTLRHPRCASSSSSFSSSPSPSPSPGTVLAISDYMQAHANVARALGGEGGGRENSSAGDGGGGGSVVVPWPAAHLHALSRLADVVRERQRERERERDTQKEEREREREKEREALSRLPDVM